MKEKQFNILLIEDSLVDTKLICKLLDKSKDVHFNIICANSLSEGLNHLNQKTVHAIVLDLSLSDSQGFETFLSVQSSHPDIAVIVLSGMDDEELALRALREGAQDYLIKGQITSHLLTRSLRYSIERKQSDESLRKANETLESHVEKRTVDLRKSNEQLSQEIKERNRAEAALKQAHEELEARISQRTEELARANEQLSLELNERRMIAEALYESETQFRTLVSNIPGVIYRCKPDEHWTMEFISEAIEDITGYPAHHFIGNRVRTYCSIIHPEDIEKHGKALREGMDPMQSYYVEYRIIDIKGNIHWFSEKGQGVYSQDGEPLWLDGAIFDESERIFAQEALKKANQELTRLSVMDGLTRIANRRKLDEYLSTEWRRMAREKEVLSLILCDIDFFKLYNDNHGHQEGDRCLQAVAQAIQSALKRPADLAARYGGEEFAVVLPSTDSAGALHVAERIRAAVKMLKIPHAHSKADYYVSLSLGVSSLSPNDQTTPETLVAISDKALYAAKEKGRDRAVLGRAEN